MKILNPFQRQKIQSLQDRAENLGLFGFAPNGKPWGKYLAEELKLTLEDEVDVEQLGKLYERAHRGDLEAKRELMSLRIETTSNFLVPTMNFGRFFEVRSLLPNESPAIQNNTKIEIRAGYIGQDGEAHMTKVIKQQSEETVDLHELVSDEVTYVTRDLYTGDITDAARATFDIAFDLAHQVEQKCFDLITAPLSNGGSLGSFVLSDSNKAKRVYVAHSRVAAGVLPTTNDVQIESIGAATKFGPKVFEEIVDYSGRFASTDPEGDLIPTGEVIVPGQDIREIASGITFTGQKATDFAEGIIRRGWFDIGVFLGVNWRIISDNTIARKKCYARFNRPLGLLWLKPSMDDEEETVNRKRNLATRWMKKVMGLAIPTHWRKNVLRVEYRT